jgi:hypothetical protein
VLDANTGGAGVPKDQRFALKGIGISFTLPAEWGTGAQPGISFEVYAPGYSAWLRIISDPTTRTLTQQTANFLAYERKRFANVMASINSRPTTVARSPANLVTVRWHSSATSEADEGDLFEFDYLFEHGGNIYIFEYNTSAKWVTKEKGVFATSLKSISFKSVGKAGIGGDGTYTG